MKCISSFYNAKLGRAETIISGRVVGNTDLQEIRNYIDSHCPIADRMVNGKDSLYIVPIDEKKLVDLINSGSVPKRGSGFHTVNSNSEGKIVDYRQRW